MGKLKNGFIYIFAFLLVKLVIRFTINKKHPILSRDCCGTSTELTDDEVAAEAFVFILAGLETTSSLMSFCLYELSLNPEAQQRLLTELDLLTNLTYDTVNSLEYLDMVIDETLRKYPPLGFLNRACNKDYLLPGTNFVIEKGTQVFVSVQGLHHDPELFPQPESFLPERFSKKNRMNIKPFSYLPFGDGPRFCIGKRYAKTTVKTGLAALLRRYRVVPPPSTTPLVLEPLTLLTKVQGGLWVCLEDRTPRDNIYC